jgi:hypothetical protein
MDHAIILYSLDLLFLINVLFVIMLPFSYYIPIFASQIPAYSQNNTQGFTAFTTSSGPLEMNMSLKFRKRYILNHTLSKRKQIMCFRNLV